MRNDHWKPGVCGLLFILVAAQGCSQDDTPGSKGKGQGGASAASRNGPSQGSEDVPLDPPPFTDTRGTTAFMASAFVSSIGLNAASTSGEALAALGELGVRTLRAGVYAVNDKNAEAYRALYEDHGTRLLLISDLRRYAPTTASVDWFQLQGGSAAKLQAENYDQLDWGNANVSGGLLKDTADRTFLVFEDVDFGSGSTGIRMRHAVPDGYGYGFIQFYIDGTKPPNAERVGTTGYLEDTGGELTTREVPFIVPGTNATRKVSGVHDLIVQFHSRRMLDREGIAPWLDEVVDSGLADALDAIEGPNEFGGNHPGWIDELADYQKELHARVRQHADPRIHQARMLTFSLVGSQEYEEFVAQAGDMSEWSDTGNRHPYKGGWNPGHATPKGEEIRLKLENTSLLSGDAPVWATEFGNHTAVNLPVTGNWTWTPVTEELAARYLLREYALHFQRRYDGLPHFERSFYFRFQDEAGDEKDILRESNFGLVEPTSAGLRKKPAYEALQRMIELLRDPWPAFAGGKLDYEIVNAPQEFEQLLLQRRDGSFFLMLWLEAPGLDKRAYLESGPPASSYLIDVPVRDVQLEVKTPVEDAKLHSLLTASDPEELAISSGSVSLTISDAPIVVELVPEVR